MIYIIRHGFCYNINMKKIIIKLLTTGLLMPLLLSANPFNNILDQISLAIRSGDADKISEYFDTNVEITILDKEAVYSKAQAKQVLKDFFNKNKPKSFQIVHKGESKDAAKYVIGTLITTANKSFRTYIYIKQKSSKYYIQELRFEQE